MVSSVSQTRMEPIGKPRNTLSSNACRSVCFQTNARLEPRYADFSGRYAFHEFAQKYDLRDDFGTTATVVGHLNFPSYTFDAAFKVALSAAKQLGLGLHLRPESPTRVYVRPKSMGKNRLGRPTAVQRTVACSIAEGASGNPFFISKKFF